MVSGKIKVCMVIATLEQGGAEKQLAMLATNLDRSRFEPAVVALSRGGHYRKVLQERAVECAIVGKKRAVSPAALLRLTRVLSGLEPDIVHTWMFTANAYGRVAARLAGIRRVVVSERDVDLWKGPLRLWLDRVLARATDCVVANSDSVARWLGRNGIPPALTAVIPNGFDPMGFRTRDLDRPPAHGDAPRLVAVGHLCPDKKRHDVVLEAMARIVRAFPGAALTIAGEGAGRPALERSVARLGLGGHVRMPGFVEDVAALLFESDLFLTASAHEGMPNAMMEAMHVGVPVVAADAPGTVDLVRDGETGVVVAAGDGRALAEAAVSLLGDPARAGALAAAARRQIADRYSVGTMVSAYEGLYERLCGTP